MITAEQRLDQGLLRDFVLVSSEHLGPLVDSLFANELKYDEI